MPKLSPEAVRRLVTAMQQKDDDDERPAAEPAPVKVALVRPFRCAFRSVLQKGVRFEFQYGKEKGK